MSQQRVIEVAADWAGLDGPTLMGHLTAVAPIFRVKQKRANEIATEVTDVVKQWRSAAATHGLPRSAQDRRRQAFRVAEAWGH